MSIIFVKAVPSKVNLPTRRPAPASHTTLARLCWVAACFVGATLCLALASFAQRPPSLPVPNACQLPSGPPPCKDSDGDGLCDSWELAKHLPNGAPLPDADPHKPDIYVQYDWMGYSGTESGCTTDADCPALWGYGGHTGDTCSGPAVSSFPASCLYACATDADCTSRGPVPASHAGERCIQNECMHTHDPLAIAPGALDAVVETFARRGFNLHILRGRELPHSHVLSYRLLNDSQHPENTMADTCEGGSVASGTAGVGKYAESFYDLKATYFDPRLAPAYHYLIFAHYNTCDTDAHCNACPAPFIGLNPDGSPKTSTPLPLSVGLAEIEGNDAMVTLGGFIVDRGGTPGIFNVGSTFMHELGHNLGLHHGGGSSVTGDAEDTPTYKPNYLSVMNYLYEFSGIISSSAVGTLNHPFTRRLDYSTQTLPTGGNTPGSLNENDLNEAAGLGSGNADIIFYSGFSAATGSCSTENPAPSQGPIDWDLNGIAGDNTHASNDLNRLDHPSVTACPTGVTQTLNGHTDWGPAPGQSVFTYKFQCTPQGKD